MVYYYFHFTFLGSGSRLWGIRYQLFFWWSQCWNKFKNQATFISGTKKTRRFPRLTNFCRRCTCSSHVCTNSEFLICSCFFQIKTVILAFYNLFWFLNENPYKKDHNNWQILWGKKSHFVDSGFVKTCDELAIERH